MICFIMAVSCKLPCRLSCTGAYLAPFPRVYLSLLPNSSLLSTGETTGAIGSNTCLDLGARRALDLRPYLAHRPCGP